MRAATCRSIAHYIGPLQLLNESVGLMNTLVRTKYSLLITAKDYLIDFFMFRESFGLGAV